MLVPLAHQLSAPAHFRLPRVLIAAGGDAVGHELEMEEEGEKGGRREVGADRSWTVRDHLV